MANLWRYFRLDGDPPKYAGTEWFTISIHHRGRFHSNSGTGYLPIVTNDDDAMDMIQFIPKARRVLDLYMVYLGVRREFSESELEHFDENPNHFSFSGHFINDLPLTDEENMGEPEVEVDAKGLDPPKIAPNPPACIVGSIAVRSAPSPGLTRKCTFLHLFLHCFNLVSSSFLP